MMIFFFSFSEISISVLRAPKVCHNVHRAKRKNNCKCVITNTMNQNGDPKKKYPQLNKAYHHHILIYLLYLLKRITSV